jgi:hypothetical protein
MDLYSIDIASIIANLRACVGPVPPFQTWVPAASGAWVADNLERCPTAGTRANKAVSSSQDSHRGDSDGQIHIKAYLLSVSLCFLLKYRFLGGTIVDGFLCSFAMLKASFSLFNCVVRQMLVFRSSLSFKALR